MAKVCHEISEWVEDEIIEPIKKKKEGQKEKCKKKKCKWYQVGCHLKKLVCYIVTFIYWVIEWITRIVGKWIFRTVCEIISNAIRIIKEIVNRLIGIPDFIGSLLGIRITKFLRLKVFILVDKKKTPMQKVTEVQRWVDFTKKVFMDKMNVELHTANIRAEKEFINIINEPAPQYALHPGCGFSNTFNDATEYYEDHCDYIVTSASGKIFDILGYGEPVFGFVVDDINDGSKDGCAYPILRNVFLVSKDPKTSTMAHEIGHLCGLWHVSNKNNLMNLDRDDKDCELNRLQIAIFRNSKYVTFFHP